MLSSSVCEIFIEILLSKIFGYVFVFIYLCLNKRDKETIFASLMPVLSSDRLLTATFH